MNRVLRRIPIIVAAAVALAVSLLAAGSSTSSAGAAAMRGSVNCSDFPNQAAAQHWFVAHGGPQSDPAGLDADSDGIACESNPCPCSTDQGGGGGGGGTPGHGPRDPQCGVVRGAATGELWSYCDRRGDATRPTDVVKTSLDVTTPRYYRVRVYGNSFVKNTTDVVRIFFDRRSNGRPEFALTWYMGKNPVAKPGATYFQKSRGWGRGVATSCKHIRKSVNYRSDVVTVAVPRSCLGNPERIRWSGFVGQIGRIRQHTMIGHYDDFPRMNGFPARWVA